MIVRVWGVVNHTNVEFHELEGVPGYWEGFAPKAKYYQDIQIWAKNHLGAIGTLKTRVLITEWSPTQVRLQLSPYEVKMMEMYKLSLFS